MKNTKKTALTTLLALLLFMFACKKEQASQAPAQRAAVPVFAKTAQSKVAHKYISTIGILKAYNSVSIVPQVDGQIISVNFEQGKAVKKGDLLVKIDPRPYDAAIMQIKGSLAQNKALLKINELEVKRNEKLVAQKYVDEQTFDTYVANVESAKGAILADEGRLLDAQTRRAWCDIVSPIDGVAGVRNIDIGNIVSSASGKSILSIQQVEPIYIDFAVPNNDLAQIRKFMDKAGGQLKIKITSLEDKTLSQIASVQIVDNAVNTNTATVRLRGLVNDNVLSKDNGKLIHKFWPGQPVEIKLLLEEIKDSVIIPSEAIFLGATGDYVYLINDDMSVTKVNVKKGQLQGEGLYDVKGIKAGQKVATTLQSMLLYPGAKVSIQEPSKVGIQANPADSKTKAQEASQTDISSQTKATK